MPDTTPCERCRRVGYVRKERTIKGDVAQVDHYCGLCGHTWSVPEPAKREPERARGKKR